MESTPGGPVTKCHCKFSLSGAVCLQRPILSLGRSESPDELPGSPAGRAGDEDAPRGWPTQGGTQGLAQDGGPRVAEAGRAVRVHLQADCPPFLSSLRFPGPGSRPAVRFREPLVHPGSHTAAVCPGGWAWGVVSHHSARWTLMGICTQLSPKAALPLLCFLTEAQSRA